MAVIKRVLCPQRLRRVPPQFSWIDHRLVRDRHICRCSHPALALYLFLVTVADGQGLSYYSDATVCRMLSLDGLGLDRARQELIAARLIAYRRPLYQVLALDPPAPTPAPTPAPACLPAGTCGPGTRDARDAGPPPQLKPKAQQQASDPQQQQQQQQPGPCRRRDVVPVPASMPPGVPERIGQILRRLMENAQ